MWTCLNQGNSEDERLAQHLDSCTECERTWQEMKQFEQSLQALKLSHPSAGFVDQVMDAVKEETTYTHPVYKRNRWATWNHLWVASAATFALFMVGSNVSGAPTDGGGGFSAITVYALKIGWKVTEIVGHLPNLL